MSYEKDWPPVYSSEYDEEAAARHVGEEDRQEYEELGDPSTELYRRIVKAEAEDIATKEAETAEEIERQEQKEVEEQETRYYEQD